MHGSFLRFQEEVVKIFFHYFLGDMVYMSHPAGREEYIMTDVGKIYGGSHNHIQGRPWVYGQFKDSVLPAVCHGDIYVPKC